MSKDTKKTERVNVQALPALKGKPQHMVVGKVYAVSPEMAEVLIEKGSAIKTDKAAGKVYDLPKGAGGKKADLTD